MKYYEKEMETIHPTGCKVLTWEEAEDAEKQNEECGWGFSVEDEMDFLIDHIRAYIFILKNGDDTAENATREMEWIEWRLEDANFHTFCELLHKHDSDGAYAWIKEDK